jgi:hypothetical protein
MTDSIANCSEEPTLACSHGRHPNRVTRPTNHPTAQSKDYCKTRNFETDADWNRYSIAPNVAGFTLKNATRLYVTPLERYDWTSQPIPRFKTRPIQRWEIGFGTGSWQKIYSGVTLGGFGGVAGFFALWFFSDVPRVRVDIVEVHTDRSSQNKNVIDGLQKIPIIGPYFHKETPASDNVRVNSFMIKAFSSSFCKFLFDGSSCVTALSRYGQVRCSWFTFTSLPTHILHQR